MNDIFYKLYIFIKKGAINRIKRLKIDVLINPKQIPLYLYLYGRRTRWKNIKAQWTWTQYSKFKEKNSQSILIWTIPRSKYTAQYNANLSYSARAYRNSHSEWYKSQSYYTIFKMLLAWYKDSSFHVGLKGQNEKKRNNLSISFRQ